MYHISCVIKSAISGYYGQSNRPTPAARQQTSDKNDFASCVSKDLLDFQYHHITTIFFIRCYGKKVKVKAFPYSIPSVGPWADPGVGLQAVIPQTRLWCYGKHYYFVVGLPYHRITLDNMDQFESLTIVHTGAIACVAFRSSVTGWNLHNWCDSRTLIRTKLNMFNPCDPGRNCCCMYGCTCSCSCMYVYTVRSSRRSVARSIAAIGRTV